LISTAIPPWPNDTARTTDRGKASSAARTIGPDDRGLDGCGLVEETPAAVVAESSPEVTGTV
jgi:hypothetical protein